MDTLYMMIHFGWCWVPHKILSITSSADMTLWSWSCRLQEGEQVLRGKIRQGWWWWRLVWVCNAAGKSPSGMQGHTSHFTGSLNNPVELPLMELRSCQTRTWSCVSGCFWCFQCSCMKWWGKGSPVFLSLQRKSRCICEEHIQEPNCWVSPQHLHWWKDVSGLPQFMDIEFRKSQGCGICTTLRAAPTGSRLMVVSDSLCRKDVLGPHGESNLGTLQKFENLSTLKFIMNMSFIR